jgi:hypothetical protein
VNRSASGCFALLWHVLAVCGFGFALALLLCFGSFWLRLGFALLGLALAWLGLPLALALLWLCCFALVAFGFGFALALLLCFGGFWLWWLWLVLCVKLFCQ